MFHPYSLKAFLMTHWDFQVEGTFWKRWLLHQQHWFVDPYWMRSEMVYHYSTPLLIGERMVGDKKENTLLQD